MIKLPPLKPCHWGMYRDTRDRDIEVAKAVLEAAAKAAELWYANGIEVEIARDIRALEVSHVE